MNPTDYDRPAWLARWGWIFVAVNAVFIPLHLWRILVGEATSITWVALGMNVASGVYCWWFWRNVVRDDAEFRALMHDLTSRRWEL